ncbi:MAG: hypothetical protein ABIJ65_10990 [Chloroflexota bacterium]
MNTSNTTGLGAPELIGKKNLFQPPPMDESKNMEKLKEGNIKVKKDRRRVRTTIELTNQALAILQDIQNSYRLRTGKVLPLWKLVSQTIEFYGQSREKKKEYQDISNRTPGVQNTPGASFAHT